MEVNKIYQYNSMQRPWPIADNSIDCCVTSPPYFGLRSYLPDGVVLKKDAPKWVTEELGKLGIKPIEY